MTTRIRALIAGSATILLFAAGIAMAKDWEKKGDSYHIEAWGDTFSVERNAIVTAASICIALDANFMEEKERETLSRQTHINGILTTTSGMAMTFSFHPELASGRAECATLADEKKVKKYRKQLAKAKK